MQLKSFNAVRRIIFGPGALQGIGQEIKRLRGNRVLVVTDPGIKAAGLVDKITAVLEKAELEYHVFAEVEPDPRVEVVAENDSPDGIERF